MLRWPAVRCGPLDRRCGAGRLRRGDAQRRAAQSGDANLRRDVCHGRAVAGTPGALQRHPPVERFALQQEVLPRQRQRLFHIVGQPQRGEREFAAVQVRVVAPAPQFGVALGQHRARAGPAAVAVLAPGRAGSAPHRSRAALPASPMRSLRRPVSAAVRRARWRCRGRVRAPGLCGRRGRPRCPPGALAALGQQRPQPAALTDVGGLREEPLQAAGGLVVAASQRHGFESAGLRMKGLPSTCHRVSGRP